MDCSEQRVDWEQFVDQQVGLRLTVSMIKLSITVLVGPLTVMLLEGK